MISVKIENDNEGRYEKMQKNYDQIGEKKFVKKGRE